MITGSQALEDTFRISADFSIESRNNLTNFVDSAVKYAKDNGKDKALKAFNDKNGTFFKKGLYVFALDFAGNSLANPTRPDIEQLGQDLLGNLQLQRPRVDHIRSHPRPYQALFRPDHKKDIGRLRI